METDKIIRHTFAVDTTTPAPGPWRMPTDTENRCRVYFKVPFKDNTSICEVSPDLEENTDASMRLIVASHEFLALAKQLIAEQPGTPLAKRANALIEYIKYG
jgi:hypothetical protein